jgi:peptidoglycan/LPS O-acetylase OafA/YrhL
MKSDNFSFSDIRSFWIRRWFRTLPNYWLILIIDLVLYRALHLTDWDTIKLLYFPFLQNLWNPRIGNFFGESWSLSIEEWFYLTLPIAMYIGYRLFLPRNKKTFLIRVFTGYLLVFALIRFIRAFHPEAGIEQDMGIRKLVVYRLDAVMFGVIFAYFNYFHERRLSKLRYYLVAVSIAGATAIFYLIASPAINITMPADPGVRIASDAFLYFFIPLFFSCCLPFANSVKTIKSKLISSVIQHISKISYSMYLIHYSLVFIPFFYPVKLGAAGAIFGYYLLYWFIVVCGSSAIYRYFEYPVMQLRDKVK